MHGIVDASGERERARLVVDAVLRFITRDEAMCSSLLVEKAWLGSRGPFAAIAPFAVAAVIHKLRVRALFL